MTPRGSASTTTWQGALVVFLCLTAALTPGGVAGQGVTGVVVEAQSSAPLPGVLVTVESEAGTRVGAVLSDASGRFVVEVPRAGRFRAVAARIGLATTTTEMFEVPAGDVHFVRVTMADNAVELEGFVVDTRVQGCRIDPAEALQIQRWWDEIRKALEVSSVVQKDQLARFRIQKYEREWSADLKSLSGERTELQIGFATRPFVSASAEFLTEGGFVQGAEGDREYYAPDADVLLADVFLAQHCFSVVDHDEDRDLIGLHFEPTRTRRVPDVLGTLWVDSTTAELQSLEYRYANIDWLPANESGGEVRFRYLPSGTWIVSDWYIRMPQVGVRYGPGSVSRSEVAGYFDVGGRVRQIATNAGAGDGATGSAEIRGTVFDSIRGRPLAGARVAVLGTRFSADSDVDGAFEISGLPAGEYQVSFFHADLSLWGVASPFIKVALEDADRADVLLAVPRFRSVAAGMCPSEGDVRAVLTGRVVDPDGEVVEAVTVRAKWEAARSGGMTDTFTREFRTGSDGRYLVCGAPAEARIELSVDGTARSARDVEIVLPTGEITYRELRARR